MFERYKFYVELRLDDEKMALATVGNMLRSSLKFYYLLSRLIKKCLFSTVLLLTQATASLKYFNKPGEARAASCF